MKLKKIIPTVLGLFLCFTFSVTVNAQVKSKYELEVKNACNFDKPLTNQTIYSFKSDIEADNALQRIMKLVGLPANFEIRAATVPNAAALIDCDDQGNCVRYILYNQEFMESINNETKTSFSEIAVLCHEIAHHLSGHTISNTGSSHDMELEADKFAGFMLFKLGASIEETERVFSNLSIEGSISHPPRAARIAAIKNGWYEAKRNGEASNSSTDVAANNKKSMPSFMYTSSKSNLYTPKNNKKTSRDGYNSCDWVYDKTNNNSVGIDIVGKTIKLTHFNSDYSVNKTDVFQMSYGEPVYASDYVEYNIHEKFSMSAICITKYKDRIELEYLSYYQPPDPNPYDRVKPGMDITYLQKFVYYFDN
jgi:hypothetical protein